MEGICAIDLDTVIPCFFVSRFRNIPRIYDAHELFSEMKEVLSRPLVKKVWRMTERWAVPRFVHGYTVSQGIADEFRKRYNVNYSVIKNVPVLEPPELIQKEERFILYQGAVNEARGLEQLIPAMQWVDSKLIICGEGNLMSACRKMIGELKLEHKILLMGNLLPSELKRFTLTAYIGINLVEPYGLNQYYSLANKFFDYIHAGIPQISMDFLSYREINQEYRVALLIDELNANRIAIEINNLLLNDVLYRELQSNCLLARIHYNWQEEEKKLIRFYHELFS
jgi:glycosyltransferase involved in cell wall biosynthesis